MPDLETTEPQIAYELNGVLWVPHYTKPLFMAPGGASATKEQLLANGATERTEQLWKRAEKDTAQDAECLPS